jgi:hypothetical protein
MFEADLNLETKDNMVSPPTQSGFPRASETLRDPYTRTIHV